MYYLFWKSEIFEFRGESVSTKIVSALAQPAIKSFRLWPAYFQWFSYFSLCWAYAKIGYSLATHSQILLSRWLSMNENWLIVGLACAKNWLLSCQAYAEKSFRCTTCIFRVPMLSRFFVPFSRPLSNTFVPCLTSLFLVVRPMSLVFRLCSLHVFRPMSLVFFLVSLSPFSRPLSPVAVSQLGSQDVTYLSLHPMPLPPRV